MAPRHAFWVIVDGSTPTAFRAKRRDDLLPTLKQLQRARPATCLKWFDRGRFWDSPAASLEALRARSRTTSTRPPGWRPGGQHADPRAKYQIPRDEKRARFKRRLVEGRGKPSRFGAGSKAPRKGPPKGPPKGPKSDE